MSIELVRVDERLIHGQVMTCWIMGKQITRIIVVDKEIAADSFMSEVLVLSAPVGVEIIVKGPEDAAVFLQEDTSETKTLLLFRKIISAKQLSDAGYTVKTLNIGNVGSSPVRSPLTREVFISEEEKEDLKELISKGTYVYLQKLPTDKEVDVRTLMK